jgi:hypothetical protein
MKRFIATIAVFGPALLIVALSGNGDKPKATASPAPVIDHSAEIAALKSEISNLKSENARLVADAAAIHAAPVAMTPAAGVLNTGASNMGFSHISDASTLQDNRLRPAPSYVASLPRHHLSSPQCAGGACGVQPAMQQRRYAAPVRQRRVFSGRIFGRR